MPTLDWLNRTQAFTTAAQVPYRLLDNVSTHGEVQHAAGNVLVQGDNLEHSQWRMFQHIPYDVKAR